MVKNILKILCLLMFSVAPGIVFADAAVSEASSVPVAAEQSKRVALAPITMPLKNSPKPTSFGRPILFYANNQPFNQPFILEHGQIFTTIEDAASALRLKMERQGDTICISGNGISKNTCPANNSNAGLIYINGKSFPESAVLNTGETWVDVSALAHSLGYRYIFNRQTQIADLYIPITNLSSNATNHKEQLNLKLQKIEIKQPEDAAEDEEAPLRIEVLNSTQRNWTGTSPPANDDIEYSFRVTNVSEKDVKNIEASLIYIDEAGITLSIPPSENYHLGTLKPDQSISEIAPSFSIKNVGFKWLPVAPHLRIKWQDKDGKTKTWQDNDHQLANSKNSLFVKPDYARTFPDLHYPTAGAIPPNPVDRSNCDIPLTTWSPPTVADLAKIAVAFQIPLTLDLQPEGNMIPNPAERTNVSIPIASPAVTADLGEVSANATTPYSPANASLPFSPNPPSSIPLAVAAPVTP